MVYLNYNLNSIGFLIFNDNLSQFYYYDIKVILYWK